MTKTIRHPRFVFIFAKANFVPTYGTRKWEGPCIGYVLQLLKFPWSCGDLSYEKEDAGFGEAIY
jgi:hypothetical protein